MMGSASQPACAILSPTGVRLWFASGLIQVRIESTSGFGRNVAC